MKLLRDDVQIDFTPTNIKEAMKAFEASSGDLWKVPVACFRVIKDFNLRVKDAAYHAGIRQLADTMKAEGFYPDKPIAGHVGVDENGGPCIWVTDGHRRLEAVQIAITEGAEIETLPFVRVPKGTSDADATFMVMTTATAVPLTKYERSVGVKRLVRFGHEVEEIAKRLGEPKSKIEELLEFSATPHALQVLVATGKVTFELALSQWKKKGASAVPELQAAAEQLAAQAKADPRSKRSTRVMPKHMPGYERDRALKTHAPEMFTTLQSIAADNAFQQLPTELREQVEKMISYIKKAEMGEPNTDSGSAASAKTGTVVSMQRAA